ncbi:MAG: hypothetical protein QG589_249 [Patescibacteria group bacterium]|nr:hypothetical protein [Patescibacteria group bacterium]
METYTQDTPEYFAQLPQEVQDFVMESSWQERVSEIAIKYSLDSTQTNTLVSYTLQLLIGLEDPESTIEVLEKDLHISRLLATQISTDLSVRIFEYAIATVEKKLETSTETQQNPDVVEQEPVGANDESFVPTNLPGAVDVGSPEDYIHTEDEVEETVQKPLPVPRFSAVEPEKAPVTQSLVEQKINIAHTTPGTKIKPQNIITEKLNAVVKPKIEKPTGIPEKYTVDPYRESIE